MSPKTSNKTQTPSNCSKKGQCVVKTFSSQETRGASTRISSPLAGALKSYNESPHRGKASNGYFGKVQGTGK